MNQNTYVLGIDTGSIAVAMVAMTQEKKIIKSFYAFHEGHIKETIVKGLEDFSLPGISSVAITASTPDILVTGARYDNRVAAISAARFLHESVGSMLIIGGEKFGLLLFDDEGNYLNYKSNSSCAAGTGSFLDQQARRLNLPDIGAFSAIAADNRGTIPRIASRCSVFAKTDLIHAQQEGYSLEEICDGLCYGLAKNVVETLFSNEKPCSPLIMTGGVSLNSAVVKHLSELTGMEITVDSMSHLYGAVGAALELIEESENKYEKRSEKACNFLTAESLFREEKSVRAYHYEPLALSLSTYPEFTGLYGFTYASSLFPMATPVEVDIYEDIRDRHMPVYLGIDIGSTSTKAVVMDCAGDVLTGLYTRTAGRPIEAVQTIFEAIDHIQDEYGVSFDFLGVGTTGSGRKFVGSIIGADEAIDEITAHARAAYALDPGVDTIIEIGGQDAKFTTIKNGMVTFSIMNNVCAAGTGSFIEEQARKLGCPLEEYSGRAEKARAPLASDRCTVFMERDINYYLSEGFDIGEVLASVLHSVRENYLTKVAIEKNIGDKIFFQGATAKNRALVAAFEHRLGKPIMVSRYCHLTGALGVALCVQDRGISETGFRGISLYRQKVPVRSEVCELCGNHCKIKIAEVGDDTVAFGFLCGRDYETKKFVNRNTSGFDLIRDRKKVLNTESPMEQIFDVTVGIPAALYLFEDVQLWKDFFHRLGVKTVTSEGFRNGVQEGKKITGAEFCAPMSELHGHVAWLSAKSDYIFLPVYMEKKKDRELRRNYCYYTQYVPSIIACTAEFRDKDTILSPVVRSLGNSLMMKVQLFKMMRKITQGRITYPQVSSAYEAALKNHSRTEKMLRQMFQQNVRGDDVDVVLLGRPYTVLSPRMNKGIPEIFGKLGVRAFFQDMLPESTVSRKPIGPILKAFHWHYASQILESAEKIATSRGLYPVLVTSFKCTPDAYTVEYFKKIMDAHEKPYLILQLDEHDSSVGYETRIEAGIRSFRNHFAGDVQRISARYEQINPVVCNDARILKGKTLLLPRWDNLLGELMAAVLQHEGVDARVVDESTESIQRSLSHNTGQCIPLNIMVQNFVEYIQKNNLDPARTVVWNINSRISCNLGMFPYYTKSLFEDMGKGMENVEVYTGRITFTDVSLKAGINMYLAFMFSGMIRKMGCRVRPYEVAPGSTDRVIEQSMEIIREAFLQDNNREEAIKGVVTLFEGVKTVQAERPKVAIFGDLYVRDNDIMNQNLIKTIEANGGEVITTPYSEMLKIIADPYIRKWFREGNYVEAMTSRVLKEATAVFERRYQNYFNRILHEDEQKAPALTGEALERFNLHIEQSGESMENALKILSLISRHDDIALFVQMNPSFCCPSLVTQAMAQHIEEITGIPVVAIEYDGTGSFKNEAIIPYLKYPRKRTTQENLDRERCYA